ncbi:MAG: sugar ABC transporter substrate-binding protein [Eubacteriales bacterium]|nr:sugar ABC transporter substrate-binding protein [Eubacteriales bacterium]
MKKMKLLSAVLATVMASSMALVGCGSSSSATADATADAAATEQADTEAAAGEETAEAEAEATETADSGDKTQIEFWTISLQPTFTDFFNGLIAKYEEENPNITVKWVDLPYDSIQEKLVTSVAGGSSPDVVNLNTQFALTLAGKGALVDLNKEATEEQRSIYIPSLYESTEIGDAAYAFPWYASPNIMFYNKELFEQAGITEIPTTYEEANALAKQMKDATGAYLYNPTEFFNLLFEEDIPVLNEDNTAAAFNTDQTADLLNSYKELTDQDILPKANWGVWDEELKLFETEKLAIVSSSGSSLSRIKDEAPDVYEKIAVAAPLTGSVGLSRNALMNVVVPEASKNHEEAIKFAAWITNDENQLAFCKEVAIFPSTTAAAADPYFTEDTETLEGQARAMSASLSDSSKDYSLGVEGQSEIQEDVNKAYQETIINGGDAKQALDAAAEEVNSDLN